MRNEFGLRPVLPWIAGLLSLSLLMLLTRGFTLYAAGWTATGLAIILQRRKGAAEAVCAAILGLSALVQGNNAPSILVIAASVILILSGERLVVRCIALGSIMLVAFQCSVTGITGLLAGAAIASIPGKRNVRYGIVAVSAAIGILFQGMPYAIEYPVRYAMERHVGESKLWEYVPPLYPNEPMIIFRTGSAGILNGFAHFIIEGGGTRNDLPIGMIISGGEIMTFGTERDTIMLPIRGENEIEIRLTRPWAPFEHPVVHIERAWTLMESD